MAISLATEYSIAVDQGANTPRVIAAVANAAVAVFVEDPQTAQHAARLAWAQKAIADPVSMGKKMIWGVVADANVQAAGGNPPDAIIQTSVNALVNGFLNA
jgi:hypothetical protein